MFSIYSTAFNIIINKFDYEDAIKNFCSFAEEVVISVNKSEDDTLEILQGLSAHHPNLKLVPCDISYDDTELDGKLFNLALQETTRPYKINLGLDHRIAPRQKENWEILAEHIKKTNKIRAAFIPSINLVGDENHWDGEYNQMWFLHDSGLKRGVVDFARNPDGSFDPSKSDSNELVDENNKLVDSLFYVPGYDTREKYENYLIVMDLYVFHLGFVNFEDKILRAQNVWEKIWKKRGVKDYNSIITTKEQLEKIPRYAHKFELWR